MLRRRRYHAASGPEFSSTSVFITPMLDMSFQILAFFVVTFTPPALETRRPYLESAGKQGGPNQVRQSKDAKPTTTTQLPPPLTVSAYADPQGRLLGLTVEEDGKLGEDGKPLRKRIPAEENPRPAASREEAEQLTRKLREELLTLKGSYPGEKRITVRLHDLLHWDYSILVMDACRTHVDSRGRETELFPKIESDLISK